LNYPGETENKLRYRINRLEEELKEERDDYKPKNLPSLQALIFLSNILQCLSIRLMSL